MQNYIIHISQSLHDPFNSMLWHTFINMQNYNTIAYVNISRIVNNNNNNNNNMELLLYNHLKQLDLLYPNHI